MIGGEYLNRIFVDLPGFFLVGFRLGFRFKTLKSGAKTMDKPGRSLGEGSGNPLVEGQYEKSTKHVTPKDVKI